MQRLGLCVSSQQYVDPQYPAQQGAPGMLAVTIVPFWQTRPSFVQNPYARHALGEAPFTR
jgi:hypothetical protein